MTALLLSSHPPTAEDQPYAHEILYFHVLNRALASGALVSVFTAVSSSLYSRMRRSTPLGASLSRTLLLHSARGSVAGLALGGLATWARMRGRDEYEWQDRSWRLLENKPQVEMDWWTLAGGAAGGAAAMFAGPRGAAGMVKIAEPRLWWVARAVGGIGLGTAAGMMACFAVRGPPTEGMKEVIKEEVDRGLEATKPTK